MTWLEHSRESNRPVLGPTYLNTAPRIFSRTGWGLTEFVSLIHLHFTHGYGCVDRHHQKNVPASRPLLTPDGEAFSTTARSVVMVTDFATGFWIVFVETVGDQNVKVGQTLVWNVPLIESRESGSIPNRFTVDSV